MEELHVKKKKSPAYSLVELVWSSVAASLAFDAMTRALTLAVESGMQFDMWDIKRIAAGMHGDAWLDGESIYAKAVSVRNVSACLALETFLKREAWVLRGHRLAVGSTSPWGTITSMGPMSFYACTYWPTGKLKTRRKVSRSLLTAAAAEAA